ncbi:MAG: PhoH family protein [Eubacteriales bacterium]
MEKTNFNTEEIQLTIPLEDMPAALFGAYDENLEEIIRLSKVNVRQTNDGILLAGNKKDVLEAKSAIEYLLKMVKKNHVVDIMAIRYAFSMDKDEKASDDLGEMITDVLAVTYRGRKVRAKTLGQRKYVTSIRKNIVTFAEGPAGTGKTYLAVAAAVVAIKKKEVERIVLTRPAVEAGEKLGFLPGDLQDKVDPYLRPLYDALYDFLGAENAKKLLEKGAIEVAPLAYMRGRTLNDSFIILDEAQNCTAEQMKMFLTRLGEGSKIVVTGDLTQTDLPSDKKSGLRNAMSLLKDIEGISMLKLTAKDVVRHHLVQNIIRAYENKKE